jgi:hypothetical protein
MDEATYATIPENLTLRQIVIAVQEPGFRAERIAVVSTLLDKGQLSAEDLAELYRALEHRTRYPRIEAVAGDGAFADEEPGDDSQRALGTLAGLQPDPQGHCGNRARDGQAAAANQLRCCATVDRRGLGPAETRIAGDEGSRARPVADDGSTSRGPPTESRRTTGVKRRPKSNA